MSAEQSSVMEDVRKALHHGHGTEQPPTPPELSEPIIRLVHSDIGLPELFTKSATNAKMHVEATAPEELSGRISRFLQEQNCKKIGLPISPLLDKLNLLGSLQAGGFDAKRWDNLTLDEAYDLDAGITDVYAAVAETGSVVIRPNPGHGRALSLVPQFHIVVVEPKNIVPDLVDLFQKMLHDGVANNTTIITGPSKTADIEGVLVTGVHGPGYVQVYLLQ